jgi:hypothetical protein
MAVDVDGPRNASDRESDGAHAEDAQSHDDGDDDQNDLQRAAAGTDCRRGRLNRRRNRDSGCRRATGRAGLVIGG